MLRRPESGWPIFAALCLSPMLAAQAPQLAGSVLRFQTTSYTRGIFGAGGGAGELMQRFDASDITGYGVEPGSPGMHVIRGVVFVAQTFVSTNPVTISLYTEDPARPDYPDLQHPLGGVGGLHPTNFPTVNTVIFPTPIAAPSGRDLFVAFGIAAETQSFAGSWLGFVRGTPSATSPYDLAGPAMPTSPPEANSNLLYRDLATDVLTYAGRGQYFLDLLTTSPSGFVTARTNQAYQLGFPGITTLMSGLHPDAASPPLHPGRADDIGFVFADWGNTVGSAVTFLASFQGFGPEVPLAHLVPGSLGALCLDPASTLVIGYGLLDNQHSAALLVPIPAAVRPILGGATFSQQAIGLGAAGALRGSQCVTQRF